MWRGGRFIFGAAALHSALLLLPRPTHCQELEPRAYAANPINIGFAVAAFGHSSGDVLVDPSAGCWFFTRNPSYFRGRTKDVRPLMSVQSHVAYTFKPGLWLAADATFYAGGRSVVDGQPGPERQESTRIGLTFSLPVWRSNSIKASWSTGTAVRLGGNFDTISVAWQSTLGGRPARHAPEGGDAN